MSEARILSVEELLKLNLVIPSYQRPYKWTEKNIRELILDIQKGIEDAKKYPNFKYRVGTVILYQENDTKPYEIVDGQQRILSFLLLKLCLNPDFTCSLLSATFSDKVTLGNLHSNSDRIREWCSSVDAGVKEVFDKALSEVLEVVVITFNVLSEAFQRFDSQKTRGRDVFPHVFV